MLETDLLKNAHHVAYHIHEPRPSIEINPKTSYINDRPLKRINFMEIESLLNISKFTLHTLK